MSTQINVFADEIDQRELHSFLRDTVSPRFVTKGERGLPAEVLPRLAVDDSLFLIREHVYLVPEYALRSLVYDDLSDLYPGFVRLDQILSLVIEYRPSVLESDGSLVKGGFVSRA